MIENLEGFEQYFTIAGFRNVKITDVDRFFSEVKKHAGKACIQFFNADLIAGPDHLRFAAVNALIAFKNKLAISNTLAIEALLYASAQHQIKESMKMLGIKTETRHVAVLLLAETPKQAQDVLDSTSKLLQGKRDDSVIDLTEEKISQIKKLFSISDLELTAKTEGKRNQKDVLTDLVIEHMALLATQR